MKKKRPNSENNNADSRAKKRWVILGFSLSLITVLLISLFYYTENRAERSLLELVNKELSPNSEVIIDDFSLSLFPIGVSIKGVQLIRHQSIEEDLPENPADAIMLLSIEEITLSGIQINSLIKRDHLNLKRFFISGVELGFVRIESDDPSESKPDRDPFPISVSNFQFNELNIKFFDYQKLDSATTSIQNFTGKITELFLPNSSDINGSTFEELEITLDHFRHFTENEFYEISLESFHLDTADDHISFNHFKLNPQYSARRMAIEVGHPIDKFDLHVPAFKIETIDLNKWVNNKEIIAGKITISDPVLLISRDNSLPREEREDRILPQLQFKNLPYTISIDSIYAENGELYYFEEISDENRAGTISFTEIDLTLSSVVNYSASPIYAEATALFMDQSDFDLSVEFSMDDDGIHTVSGNLYQLDLTTMNSTLENLAFIRLSTGILHQLNFRFQGDDDRSSGDLILIYSDLDLRFIDVEEQRERRRDRLRSFIANTFVIRSYNPAEDPRIGEIEFERDKERSIFNYWLHSLSSGLIDTIKR